jgi:hypothetical protein
MMNEDTNDEQVQTQPDAGNPANYPRYGEAAEALLEQAIEELQKLPDDPNDNAKQVAIAKVQETRQFLAELL